MFTFYLFVKSSLFGLSQFENNKTANVSFTTKSSLDYLGMATV